jgi:hypothetical protein
MRDEGRRSPLHPSSFILHLGVAIEAFGVSWGRSACHWGSAARVVGERTRVGGLWGAGGVFPGGDRVASGALARRRLGRRSNRAASGCGSSMFASHQSAALPTKVAAYPRLAHAP